jgi:S1 RNA binding domain protein
LSTRPFKHPLDIVHTGDIVEAQIISVEAKKNRIALSIKALEKVKNRRPRH